VLLTGDTDDGPDETVDDDFARAPGAIVRDMLGGGVSLPWTLAASMAIGVWLLLTRLTLGAEGTMADADHLIGSLVLTVAVMATAESARPVRYLNVLLGMALVLMPFVAAATLAQTAAGVVCGLALVALSLPRGAIHNEYGSWSWLLV
jgi:hypothetical protein